MAQWYAQVGGQRFGPVGEDDIRAWFAQGRVKPTDFVWSEDMANWAQAGAVFGAAQPAGQPQNPPPIPAAYPAAPAAYYAKPHRGTLVLVMGILSIVVCFICGIVAWVMANNDLREMAAGTMDPAGEANTKAGRTCGIIGTILGICLLVLIIVIMAIGLVGAFAAGSYSSGSFP